MPGLSPASSEASRGKGSFGGSHTRRCTHKAVHTQGGAHKRRFVATAGVLLFKGGCRGWPPRRAKRDEAWERWAVHTQGRVHTRRCTHKAVQHKRWFVATVGVFFSGGGMRGLDPASSEASRGKGRFGGSHTRRCTHKAVDTQGSAHNKRSVATAVFLLFKGGCRGWSPRRAKRAEAREGLVVHTQGGAPKRRFVATTGILLCKGGCGGWPPCRAKRAICRAK